MFQLSRVLDIAIKNTEAFHVDIFDSCRIEIKYRNDYIFVYISRYIWSSSVLIGTCARGDAETLKAILERIQQCHRCKYITLDSLYDAPDNMRVCAHCVQQIITSVDDDCSICREPLWKQCTMKLSECEHHLHVNCADELQQKVGRIRCPLCRKYHHHRS